MNFYYERFARMIARLNLLNLLCRKNRLKGNISITGIKICFFLLFFSAKMTFSLAQSDFTISPPIIDLTLGRGGTKVFSFELTNINGEKSAEFKVFALDLDVGRDGTTDFLPVGESKYSCSKWIKVEQKEIFIGPGKTKKIIGKLSVPGSAISGGYYSAIVCELLPEKAPRVKTGTVITWRIATLLKVSVLGGRVEKVAELENFSQRTLFEDGEKKEGITFVAALKNKGNIHITAEGKLLILTEDRRRKGEVVFDVGTGTVLPEHVRDFTAVYDKFLPEGNYLARATFRYGGMSSLIEEIPFSIKVGGVSGKGNEVIISSLRIVPDELKLRIPAGGFRTEGFKIQNQRMDDLLIHVSLSNQSGIKDWFRFDSQEFRIPAGKEIKVVAEITIPPGTKEGVYADTINLEPVLINEQQGGEKVNPVNVKVTIEIPDF